MNEKLKEIIHNTAVAIRELVPKVENFAEDWPKIDEVLSRKDSSKPLITAVNALLREYGESPIEEIDGYGILALDDCITQMEVCQQCSDPLNCPFLGDKLIPIITPQGVCREHISCARWYRARLIREIEDLTQREIPSLVEKSTDELAALLHKLKGRVK